MLDIIVLTLIIGFLIGGAFVWWSYVTPLADELDARDLIQRRQTRQAIYRSQARSQRGFTIGKHPGTPYITPPPSELERTLAELSTLDALLGNDDWSKKAHLRSVS
jgi:hypothetical protein